MLARYYNSISLQISNLSALRYCFLYFPPLVTVILLFLSLGIKNQTSTDERAFAEMAALVKSLRRNP